MSDVLINGAPGDAIQVMDRGLAYGDGVFRTMAVSGGKPEFWPRHMAKLAADCALLGIPAPDAAALAQDARTLLAGADQAVLKIIVTRGSGGRGYKPPQPATPTRIVLRAAWPGYSERLIAEGVQARWCETTLGLQPKLAGVKHLNRLEQVLAREEWAEPEIFEGLMRDTMGRVVEGVMTNLFIVTRNRAATPIIKDCGVAGIMRTIVKDLMGAEERHMTAGDVMEADELYLTNSLIGCVPVRQLEEKRFHVGASAQKWALAIKAARDASLLDFPA